MNEEEPVEQSKTNRNALIALSLAALFAVLLTMQVQRYDDKRQKFHEQQQRQVEQIFGTP
jgi:hypothetical protein